MSNEVKKRPANLVDHMIWEQLQGEKVGFPVKDRQKLIENLIKQSSNRIYYGTDGTVGRALLFSGQYNFEAFIEVLRLEGEEWRRVKGETFVGAKSEYVEQAIGWMRQRFRLGGDLLTQPTHAYRIDHPGDYSNGGFIHTAERTNKPPIWCQYKIPYPNEVPYVGPYMEALEIGQLTVHPDRQLTPLDQPPKEILQYAQRFQVATIST